MAIKPSTKKGIIKTRMAWLSRVFRSILPKLLSFFWELGCFLIEKEVDFAHKIKGNDSVSSEQNTGSQSTFLFLVKTARQYLFTPLSGVTILSSSSERRNGKVK